MPLQKFADVSEVLAASIIRAMMAYGTTSRKTVIFILADMRT
jgi:hypothetical protein